MEHRCLERIESELDILIHKYSFPVASGRLKNASHGGVFVETRFSDIDCEQQVDLEVVLPSSSAKKKSILIKALVIHKTTTGFGAAIDFQNAEVADLFITALNAARPSQKPTHILAMAV